MSLIDEALKRAQAADRGSAPPLPVGSTPIHLPDRRPRWRRRALWVAAALSFTAVGIWFGVHRRGEAVPTRPAPERAISIPVPITAPPFAPTALASAAQARVLAAPPTPAARHSTAPSSSEPAPSALGTATRDAATESGAPHALVDGKTYSGEILLGEGAKITLDGIVYSDDNPVALINGHVLGPGTSIEGMTISRIQADRVVLEGRGATVSLLVK